MKDDSVLVLQYMVIWSMINIGEYMFYLLSITLAMSELRTVHKLLHVTLLLESSNILVGNDIIYRCARGCDPSQQLPITEAITSPSSLVLCYGDNYNKSITSSRTPCSLLPIIPVCLPLDVSKNALCYNVTKFQAVYIQSCLFDAALSHQSNVDHNARMAVNHINSIYSPWLT